MTTMQGVVFPHTPRVGRSTSLMKVVPMRASKAFSVSLTGSMYAPITRAMMGMMSTLVIVAQISVKAMRVCGIQITV